MNCRGILKRFCDEPYQLTDKPFQSSCVVGFCLNENSKFSEENSKFLNRYAIVRIADFLQFSLQKKADAF